MTDKSLQLICYLAFDGNCDEAVRYYEKHLRGKLDAMIPFRGSPAEQHVPEEWLDKVLHAQVKVGDAILMASDAPPGTYRKPEGITVNIYLRDVAEAERIFTALADGGEVKMPLGETFWARRFGMVIDRFGTPWMVNCEATQ